MNYAKTTGIFCAGVVMLSAGAAQAVTTATFTADNHYGLYADYGGMIDFIGANETGAAGAPGAYNWSQAETFNFTTPDTVYIAAWSDDRVAQGLIGQINFDGREVLTGDEGWEVYATGISLNDGAPVPDASLIGAQIALADLNDAWELPYVGFDNTSGTPNWGQIAGISDAARWVWRDSGRSGDNPLIGDFDHDEFLIFRMRSEVPTPGAASVIAMGGLAAYRRRRAA